jgi:2-octaprenyl-6-methoxyphenol hydroxylase
MGRMPRIATAPHLLGAMERLRADHHRCWRARLCRKIPVARASVTLDGDEVICGPPSGRRRWPKSAWQSARASNETGWGVRSLVCAVDHNYPHNGIAHQFFMPGGPLSAFTGQPGSIVWSESSLEPAGGRFQ